ncbi:unnamed protein product [Protopolystoma xenopodis]|uniref:Golgin-84 n=1 Tax=Protopolystoma xenopodis TaxID=117903 RepID=A0A448XIR9_9PLAT|nr:unnamed protein product [Protopolystoma xenopodis]
MSWLAGLTSRAESLLNNLDNSTAAALQTVTNEHFNNWYTAQPAVFRDAIATDNIDGSIVLEHQSPFPHTEPSDFMKPLQLNCLLYGESHRSVRDGSFSTNSFSKKSDSIPMLSSTQRPDSSQEIDLFGFLNNSEPSSFNRTGFPGLVADFASTVSSSSPAQVSSAVYALPVSTNSTVVSGIEYPSVASAQALLPSRSLLLTSSQNHHSSEDMAKLSIQELGHEETDTDTGYADSRTCDYPPPRPFDTPGTHLGSFEASLFLQTPKSHSSNNRHSHSDSACSHSCNPSSDSSSSSASLPADSYMPVHYHQKSQPLHSTEPHVSPPLYQPLASSVIDCVQTPDASQAYPSIKLTCASSNHITTNLTTDLAMENKVLRSEVSSLNQEVSSLLRRNRRADEETKRLKDQVQPSYLHTYTLCTPVVLLL